VQQGALSLLAGAKLRTFPRLLMALIAFVGAQENNRRISFPAVVPCRSSQWVFSPYRWR
jgi:hypothetical protein